MKTRSLAAEAFAETLWGRRGLVKTVSVFLALSALADARTGQDDAPGLSWYLRVFFATACWSQYSILINDLTDRHVDERAGKRRWIMRLRPAAGWTAAMAAAAIGLAMLALVGGIAPLAAGALACALTWLYSVPPAQLKTRGVAGLWAYAGASALGFVGVPFAAAGGTGYNVGVLGLAVFADKWVNLHFHQVLDAESDGASAQGTYAVRVGVPHARRTLAAAVAVAVTAMLATAATTVSATDQKLAVALMLALAAALPIVHSRRRRGTARATPLDHELPPLYLGLTFAVFRALPLLLLAKTLFVSPAMLPVTGLALILCIVEGVQSLRYRHG